MSREKNHVLLCFSSFCFSAAVVLSPTVIEGVNRDVALAIFIFGSGQTSNKIYVLQHVKNQRLENKKYANKFKDWYTGLTRAVVKW